MLAALTSGAASSSSESVSSQSQYTHLRTSSGNRENKTEPTQKPENFKTLGLADGPAEYEEPGAAQDDFFDRQKLLSVHSQSDDGLATSQVEEKSLSKLQSFNLWLLMLFMGTQLSLPYTLSVYLVRDFYSESGASEQLIGQLTGLLAAAQSFSRSLTAYPWGLVSDVLGRKICVLVGTLASMASILGFGLSRSYTAAMLARAIPALFVGSPVALKSMIGDACDQTGQAKAMAIFNLGHGLGTILGPAMGGLLAYPCRRSHREPFCGEAGILRKRPFLLPCLAVVILGAVAFLSNLLLLKESHPSIVAQPGSWWGNLLRIITCRRQSKPYEEVAKNDSLRGTVSEQPSRRSDVEMGRVPSVKDALQPDAGRQTAKTEHQHQQQGRQGSWHEDDSAAAILPQDVQGPKMPSGVPETPWHGQEQAALSPQEDHSRLSSADSEQPESVALLQKQEPLSSSESSADPEYRWWRDKNVRLALIASGMCAFLYNFQDEMAPIFVSAPIRQGGLSMPLEEFTWPLSFGGLALVVFSLSMYPRLIKRFGAITMCRAGLLLGIPATVILPLASLFTGTYVLEQVCVFLSASCHSIAKVCALNSSMIAVNIVAPKAAMGAVNGGAMTLQSGGRALGPLLSGSVWAIVVSLHVAGQQFVGFSLIAVSFALTQFLYLKLRLPSS